MATRSLTRRAPNEVLREALVGVAAAALAGVVLGGASWLSDQLDWPLSLLIPANAIGVWLATAFAVGAFAHSVPAGTLRGLVALVVAIATYYLLFAVLGTGVRVAGAGHAAAIWGGVALVFGPVFGAAGAAWRTTTGWPQAVAVAIFAAALVAEGVAFGLGRLVHLDLLAVDPGALLYGAEIAIGLVLPAVLLKGVARARGYLLMIVLAAVGAISIGPLTDLLRGMADRF